MEPVSHDLPASDGTCEDKRMDANNKNSSLGIWVTPYAQARSATMPEARDELLFASKLGLVPIISDDVANVHQLGEVSVSFREEGNAQ